MHFSTDYVFDGSGSEPWRETDTPNPLNAYGRTKLEGEEAIAASGCQYLIFRTSWVYASHGSNFLLTMLRLGRQKPELRIIDDQVGAPTSAKELSRGVAAVLGKIGVDSGEGAVPESGIYHMTCSGATSWYGFARAIFTEAAGLFPAPHLVPITSEEYPTPARRPPNSILNCDKLERAFGVRLAKWERALSEVIDEIPSAGK